MFKIHTKAQFQFFLCRALLRNWNAIQIVLLYFYLRADFDLYIYIVSRNCKASFKLIFSGIYYRKNTVYD